MHRGAWLGWVGGGVIGILVGGAAALAYTMPRSQSGALPALPRPSAAVAGKRDPNAPQLTGAARAAISKFSIEDLEGNVVVSANEISAGLDLVALGAHTIHMPGGHVRGVTLLLRRGKSGRISLAEALGRGAAEGDQRGNVLAIGPMQITDTRMTVAVNDRAVVFQIDRALVQVQRKRGESAPKVFLSEIHGHMTDPDPLPQPVRIRGGRGVIDLGGHPLVDLRARACIGGDEMRVRIEVPERQGLVNLRVDAEGFSGRTVRVALNMVSKSKERLEVSSGPVEVTEAYDCSRAEGKAVRERVKHDPEPLPKGSR